VQLAVVSSHAAVVQFSLTVSFSQLDQ